MIVKDGRLVSRANEAFSTAQLSPHDPRTAVGQRADGKIVMVAVDGRQPGYSAGVTNLELAQAMMQLGAVSASALDAGGSTTMAFDGKLLNSPSDRGGERSVAEALLVSYTGVYVPPLPEAGALAERRRRRGRREPVLQGRAPEHRAGEPRRARTASTRADRRGTARARARTSSAGQAPDRRESGSSRSRRPTTSTQTSAAERTFTLNNTLAALCRAAEGAEAAQEGHAPARVVQARAGRRRSPRRSRPAEAPSSASSRAGPLGAGTQQVEWNGARQLRRARVRRVVQAARLGGEQARPRRPVRAVLGTPVVSRRCSSRALRAR